MRVRVRVCVSVCVCVSTGLISTGMVVVLQTMQLPTLCARQYPLAVAYYHQWSQCGLKFLLPPSHPPHLVAVFIAHLVPANTNSIDNICNLIEQALVQRKQIKVCDDLNVNMLSPEYPQTRAMSEYIITRDLHQPIEIPTRITPNSASLLDMFLVNPKEIVKTSSVLDVSISDHSMITLTLCWRKLKSPSPCVVRRSYKKFNADKFREDLAAVP